MKNERLIIHIDMDAFFAAIEQRDDPTLKGQPVIIGADPKKGKGRGVVSTCSYEARVFGIHSAMPISKAYALCPHGKFVPPSMEKYSKESQLIRIIFDRFTPEVEMVSIDEAFLDITGTSHTFQDPIHLCKALKKMINDERGLTASIGLAPNKLVAKIASEIQKPDGLTHVSKENVRTFLQPLAVERIWGIGKKSLPKFHTFGIFTIGDLQKYSKDDLCALFGTMGNYFWNISRGHDTNRLSIETACKSVSNEHTFEKDVGDDRQILQSISYLCEQVSSRLRKQKLKGRTLTLKIRLTGFKTFTRSITIAKYTNFVEDIYGALYNLYDAFDKKGQKVRLIGVKVSNFSDRSIQHDIFNFDVDSKREKIYDALDKIRDKFGTRSIHHADQII